jgi:general secretion pathway protein D
LPWKPGNMVRSTVWILALVLPVASAAQQTAPAPAPQTGTAAAAQTAPASPQTSPAAVPAQASNNAAEAHTAKGDRDKAQRAFLQGAKDLEHNNARGAVDAFTRAVSLDPGNRRYAVSLDMAKQHLVQDLIQQADKAKILGHFTDARAAIQQAYELDPANPQVAQHAEELAADVGAAAPAAQPTATLAGPTGLTPKDGRHSFHLRASQRDVIRQVLTAYGIQPTVDDSVQTKIIRYDVDDVDFADVERTLPLVTNTFIVPLDPVRALVAKDTKENHTKFEREAVETVYLPGLAAQDLTDLVTMTKNVFAVPSATAAPGRGTLTIRAPADDLNAVNATVTSLLDARSELVLDVDMYEVDRSKANAIGAILPTQTTLFNVYSEASQILQQNQSLVEEIISSGLAAPGDWEAILAILVASGQLSSSIASNPFGVFGGGLSMTGVEYQGGSASLQLNSTDVHSVDQMQLRMEDGGEGIIKIGEKYPIETSSYSSLSGTGTGLNIPGLSTAGISSTLSNLGVNLQSLQAAANETIPQVQYQDIGLTLDVTPRIENSRSISLKFDLKLTALAGSSLNSLPLLNNREYQAITSVNVGESAVLVSALSKQESDALTGIPGLGDIPGFEAITDTSTNFDYSKLAIVVTPHLVRRPHQQFAQQMYILPHGQ